MGSYSWYSKVVCMQIYRIGGVGFDSNIYLIDDEIPALVDAGTGMRFRAVRSQIKKLGFGLSDIRLLVNTHCHFDHAGGDRDFVDASGCEVTIHEFEARLLESGDAAVSCAAMFGEELRPVEVSRALKEGDMLELGELILEVIHTPGHTVGGISLYNSDRRILFSGDTVFCGGVGRTDLPTGDEKALGQSLERLRGLAVEKLYPGHGPAAERDGGKYILEAIELLKSGGVI
jgi:glyoxylase-like metal-dependent hydrolase (beta-lactamase superfamily II)